MNQAEFESELLAWGYKRHSTASRKWRIALVRRNTEKTFVVLLRRHGVDLLESPLSPEQMTNDDGLLSISTQREGDRYAELGYTEAGTSIHDLALHIASSLAQDQPVGDELFERRGIGPREWAMKYGQLAKKARHGGSEGGGTMSEIYDAVSNGDGDDAYLSDGVWIRSDGSMYER